MDDYVGKVVGVGTTDDVDVVGWCVGMITGGSNAMDDDHKNTGEVIILRASWSIATVIRSTAAIRIVHIKITRSILRFIVLLF